MLNLFLIFAGGGAGWAKDPGALVKAQLKTAIFHAGELAVRGVRGPQATDSASATRLHLQHVINCIEGTDGKDFKAAAGYPCDGQGNGILVDLNAAEAAGVKGAARASIYVKAGLHVALMAVGSADVNESQPFAAVVARNLQSADEALK